MKIEELKKARDTLSKVLKCHKTSVINCKIACDTCPNNYFSKEEDRALDTAITVMGDVIKQMERMEMADHVSSHT